MKNRPKKKLPSDYPQYSFRLNNLDEKEKLEKLINITSEKLNKKLSELDKKYTKSEIILQALEIGLKQINKNP